MSDNLTTEYINTWMNFTSRIYDFGYQGSCGITGPLISDYMTQILGRLRDGVYSTDFLENTGPFNGYIVETWNSVRADQTDDSIDWDIEHSGGLTVPKLTKVNHQYASPMTYGHEFFHNYGFACDIYFAQKTTQVGTYLENEFIRLRGRDFTSRTSGVERFAEDGRFFFGPNNGTGRRSTDDAQTNANIRWADQVVGLKKFLQYCWPVYNYLKDKNIQHFIFLENQCDGGWFQWENLITGRWEGYAFGQFYKYNGWTNQWDSM